MQRFAMIIRSPWFFTITGGFNTLFGIVTDEPLNLIAGMFGIIIAIHLYEETI